MLYLASPVPDGATTASPMWTATGGMLGMPMDGPHDTNAVMYTAPADVGNYEVQVDWGAGCIGAVVVTVSTEVAMDASDADAANDDGGGDTSTMDALSDTTATTMDTVTVDTFDAGDHDASDAAVGMDVPDDTATDDVPVPDDTATDGTATDDASASDGE
jgi:hypothetical protein